MRLTRYEPFREMDEFFKGFAPLLGRFPAARFGEGMEEFLPLADIIERDKEYLIKLDLPEVRKEDVKVLYEDGVLTIKGERKEETEGEGSEVLYRGIAARSFERRFQLADHVEVSGATLKNGLLHIDLKRNIPEEMKPRKIDISVGGKSAKQIEAKAGR